MTLLITDVVVGDAETVDVRIESGRIAEIGRSLSRGGHDMVIAGWNGALVPGLHDHHIHLRALAARQASVVVGPPHVRSRAAFEQELVAAARSATERAPRSWVRAVDYHESVAGDLDRDDLDRLVPDVPVRVQHRGGALWVLNSAAIHELGLETAPHDGVDRDASGRVTGRLWRADALLRDRVPRVANDLAALGTLAAANGVTGFTDADPDRTADDLIRFGSELPQRVLAMGPVGLRPRDADDPALARVCVGPVKVLLDDDTLPPIEELAAIVRAAHADERAVAFHCVTRAQLVTGLLALEQAGTTRGDRVEHGSVIPDELIARLRALGVTVVTQPNFVFERGDEYLEDVDPDDRPLLYRCASLRRAGVAVAAGTDAPFGDPDPWLAIRAAIRRETRTGVVLGPEERLAPNDALALFLGDAHAPGVPRRVEVGAPADLCILDGPLPLAVRDRPGGDSPVVATLIAGDVVYERTR